MFRGLDPTMNRGILLSCGSVIFIFFVLTQGVGIGQTKGGGIAKPVKQYVVTGKEIQESSKRISDMRETRSLMYQDLRKAKELKKVTVFDCIKRKLNEVLGHIKLAQKAEVAMEDAITENEAQLVGKYRERIGVSHKRIEELFKQSKNCWEDRGEEEPTTVITIKTPKEFERESPGERQEEDLEDNFGFPEIPPASPFR
jgi:hypothetical protein